MTKRVVILVLCFFVALFSFPILTACGKKEHLPAQLTHNHEHLNTDDVCDKCGWQVLLKTNDGEQVYLVKEGNVSAEYYCETITKYSLANPLVSVYISNNVTCIGSSAFRGCFNLSSIIIPDSVTIIGQQSFYGCDGLTSITIPNSVTTIEDNAFADCNNLTSITIPDSVTSIGNGAFYCCSELTNVYYMGTVSQWASIAGISTIMNYKDSRTKSNKKIYISNKCLSDIKEITIENIQGIASGAFYGCNNLKRVTISDSVEYIGSYACAGTPQG